MATRRERVVLDLQDNFTGGMARAAAATALLNRELNSLSGQQVAASRSSQVFVRDIQRMGNEARGVDSSINQLTGRIRVLAEVGAIAGQTLGPLGGVAIAGIGGLANQMGAAAIAGGVLIGSLQGVGDALGAMNKAQLDPTDKNLEAAEDALRRLSPAARDFAEAAFDLNPALTTIRDLGAEELMPGLTESLDNLERLGPRVGSIFETLAGALGDIASDSTASLASERWTGFFEFIEREVPATITELAAIVGDLTHGMAELWEAFTPLNDDFSSWMMGVAQGFDEWATGLSATEGFQEFIDYIRTTGPQVADTLGALGSALVQIVQASAPLGGPVLAGLEAVADVVSSIADSDLGTPIMAGVTALALLNRTLAVTASLSKMSLGSGLFAGLGTVKSGAAPLRGLTGDLRSMSKEYGNVGRAQSIMLSGLSQTTGAAQRTRGALADVAKTAGPTAAVLGGLAIASSGAADGFGLTNTISLGLAGTLAGPWGAAVGAGAGLLLDLKSANDQTASSFAAFEAALQSMSLDELNAKLRETNELFSEANKVGETGGPKGETDAAKAIKAQIDVTEQLEAEAKSAALAFLRQTGANQDLGKWSRKTAEQIKAQANAIIEAQDAAKKTASSFVTLGDSLNDSKTSLGDWIKQMADSADALINFTKNSKRAAENGLNKGLIASLQDAGEEGALRMRQLANATDEEIGRANAAWRKGQKAMEDYANFKVPPKVIKVDNRDAMSGIAALEARLRAIKDEDVFVNVRHRNMVDSGFGPQNAAADGATVPKTGKPYADRHLYLLADGEEVISNRYGQADRHRPLLKAINGGLADGGTAGDDKKKKRRRKFNGEQTDWTPLHEASEQAAMQAAEAAESAMTAWELANTEAERRAEHESAMFLAAIEGQERAAQGLIDAAKEQKQSAEQVRDGWAQAMERAGSAATSGFQSSLFSPQQSGLFSGGGRSGTSWLDALTGDIAGLQQRQGLISQLSAQGVTGSALEALLAQGSNAQVQTLLGSGRAGDFASMFAQREALLASTSQMAGRAAYGAQYDASAAAVAAVDARIAFLEAQLAYISGQRPINVYESASATATAMEIARLQALGAA